MQIPSFYCIILIKLKGAIAIIRSYKFLDADYKMISRLQSFLPDKIFDAHAHIYNNEIVKNSEPMCSEYGSTDITRFLTDQKVLYGERLVKGMFLPWPDRNLRNKDTRNKYNAWIAENLNQHPESVAEIFVLPEDTKEDIESLLIHPNFKGIKCYFNVSAVDNGPTIDIKDFLPEAAWKIADKRSLAITLHLVKNESFADKGNITYIKEMVQKYPNAKLILAHCARAFAPWTILENLHKIREFKNIYYDLSAICEPTSMFQVIKMAGVDHVLWGSDYPSDRMRGRPFSCGETFTWLSENDLKENTYFPTNLMCLESLFAFYQTSIMLDLTKKDIEDIFYNNAIKLFNLND